MSFVSPLLLLPFSPRCEFSLLLWEAITPWQSGGENVSHQVSKAFPCRRGVCNPPHVDTCLLVPLKALMIQKHKWTSEIFTTGNHHGKSLFLHLNQVNYFRPKAVISFQQSASLLGQGKSILQEPVLFSVCSLSVCLICGTMWLFHDLISYSLSWYI